MDMLDRLALLKDPAFWRSVDRSGSCWVWTSTTDQKGYGRHHRGGRNLVASRYAWQLANGAIPSRMMICHDCDTPSCVRPTHLRIGTAQDNFYDMVSKGRHDRAAHPFEAINQSNRVCWFGCGRDLPATYPAHWNACPECRETNKAQARSEGHTSNCRVVRHAGEGTERCNCGRKVPIPPPSKTEVFVALEPSVSGSIVVCGVLVRAGRRVRYWSSLASGDGSADERTVGEAFSRKLDDVPRDAPIFHYGARVRERLLRTLPESPVTSALTARLCNVLPIVKQHLEASGSLRSVAEALGVGRGAMPKGFRATGELWRVWHARPTEKSARALRKYNSDDLRMLMAVLDLVRQSATQ
jgi:HNH endonuclease/RNase_H superfamily